MNRRIIFAATLFVPIAAQAQSTDDVLERLNKVSQQSNLSTDPSWKDRIAVAHLVFDVPGKPISREQAIAIAAWPLCTEKAADRFAKQPEPARTVAEAAIEACAVEEMAYMVAVGLQSPQGMREAQISDLVARIMAIRSRAN